MSQPTETRDTLEKKAKQSSAHCEWVGDKHAVVEVGGGEVRTLLHNPKVETIYVFGAYGLKGEKDPVLSLKRLGYLLDLASRIGQLRLPCAACGVGGVTMYLMTSKPTDWKDAYSKIENSDFPDTVKLHSLNAYSSDLSEGRPDTVIRVKIAKNAEDGSETFERPDFMGCGFDASNFRNYDVAIKTDSFFSDSCQVDDDMRKAFLIIAEAKNAEIVLQTCFKMAVSIKLPPGYTPKGLERIASVAETFEIPFGATEPDDNGRRVFTVSGVDYISFKAAVARINDLLLQNAWERCEGKTSEERTKITKDVAQSLLIDEGFFGKTAYGVACPKGETLALFKDDKCGAYLFLQISMFLSRLADGVPQRNRFHEMVNLFLSIPRATLSESALLPRKTKDGKTALKVERNFGGCEVFSWYATLQEIGAADGDSYNIIHHAFESFTSFFKTDPGSMELKKAILGQIHLSEAVLGKAFNDDDVSDPHSFRVEYIQTLQVYTMAKAFSIVEMAALSDE
jgi:hypothetical protein